MRTIGLYHRRRLRLAALAATAATIGALVLAGAGAASASTGPTPNVPYGYTYQIQSYVGSLGFWWLAGDGKVETYTGAYISVKPTQGTNQEYVDVGTKNCLTYHSANYIYEKGCGNSYSQQWRTTLLSDGYWLIKNNYLGTGYCAQATTTFPYQVVLQRCANGNGEQEWNFRVLN